MSVFLRKHGLPWAEFELFEGFLGKTVSLRMRRDGEPPAEILTISVVGDHLVYSASNNQPVLGGTEHAPKKPA